MKTKPILGVTLTAIWLLFTVTLAAWWIYFNLRQLNQLAVLNPAAATELGHHRAMIIWEGGTLLASLIVGGLALLYYIRKEVKERHRIQQFFAAFTHEIKTPLASTRLKSEILKEKITDPDKAELVNRIIADVGRLSLQLENSLFMVQKDQGSVYIERCSVSQIIEGIREYYNPLQIVLGNECIVTTDKRILETIFANLFQNAVAHGKATTITVACSETIKVHSITITDDGIGFSGDRKKLGELFTRHYTGSGSGLGLHIVRSLLERIGGHLLFPATERGFMVVVEIPKGREV